MRIYLYAFLAMICWGTAPLFGKIGLNDVSPFIGLSVRIFIIAVILLLFGLVTDSFSQLNEITSRNILFLAGEGILASLIGHLAYFFALKYGATSQVVPFIAAYPLVTFILGVIVLKEGFSLQKLSGAVLITIGIFLLN